MKLAPVLTALLLFIAPGGSAATASPPPEDAPSPPALRLPPGAHPTRYALDLTLSPESDDFHGTVDIDLVLESPLRALWLNATGLDVEQATLDIGGRKVRPRVVPGGDDFVGFATEEPVGPGPAVLHLSYAGKASSKEEGGAFRQQEGADWYLFSQFEATDARKAIPCFDEPAYKVPWQITIRVKRGLSAVSNSPVASETETQEGMKVVRFAETKPLPSYLVAFGVGPFDFAQGPPVGSKHAPFRVVVPKGQAAGAAYALRSIPEIVTLLERYFGTPYPYEKLDFLAVPIMGGAMENAGLITFGRRFILARPEEERLERQRRFSGVAAHELAHMWFGDLVTMKWWDDVWLNESFASWMANKIVEQWKPDWDVPVDRVEDRSRAIGEDRLVSARRIRQPIETSDDIQNVFDPITYEKGSAILTMIEQWTGQEPFQKAVQGYLSAHAWGNADSGDFFAALSAVAGKEVEPIFRSFVDQGGVPLVTVRLVCAPGAPPALRLAQRRYLPAGSKGSADQVWKIPVCFRYGSGDRESRQCAILSSPEAEVPLGEAKGCPDWLLPNDGARGYYLARFEEGGNGGGAKPAGAFPRLFQDGASPLSVPERVGVVADLSALVSAGEMPMSDLLSLLPAVIRDGNRHTLELAAEIAGGLRQNLVPTDLLPNYRRFIARTFQAKERALGLSPRAGEPEDDTLLRPALVALLADAGEDEAVQRETRGLALKWLQDPSAVSAEMVNVVLGAGLRHGDRSLFDRFHAAARGATDRNHRSHCLAGMSAFQDPGIVRDRMALLLTDEFDVREANNLLMSAMGEPALREMGYAFVKDHYAALAAKLPKEAEAYLAFSGGSFCDPEHRKDVESFFSGRTGKSPGGPRILAQVLEQIDLCVARKRIQQASVEAFLRSW
jgi:alanyl aminopeptidase